MVEHLFHVQGTPSSILGLPTKVCWRFDSSVLLVVPWNGAGQQVHGLLEGLGPADSFFAPVE